jgi:hypothetical protein
MRLLIHPLVERIVFTLVIVGILLGLFSVYRIIATSLQLNDNPAEQIQRSGEELNIQSTAEGRGLVAADLERRELVRERAQMIAAGGISLVLIGIGWAGYDLHRSQRRKADQAVDGGTL